MSDDDKGSAGPDLTRGIDESALSDGEMVAGQVNGEAVLVARRGLEVFAVGATCTHYGGPLAEGILADGTVRCPWHHACFDLRTGEPGAPALRPIPCWDVERKDGLVRVVGKRVAPPPSRRAPAGGPRSIVIVGGGAGGHAAAEMLRRLGFDGRLTMLTAEHDPPCDRPNLSKDYLSGTAPEDWIPLRSPEFFRDRRIELVLGARVEAIEVGTKQARVAGGASHAYDALLLAPGAEPVRLKIPGCDLPHVHYLRTLADSRAIIAGLAAGPRAVVLGASFIGLEVAASLRARGVAVTVVAPEASPLERVLGPELGRLIRQIHEEHGVVFHLGRTAARIEPDTVVLDDGTALKAELVVAGIGVRPRVELAERAGLAVDDGIVVSEHLETSAPGIFAAGDVARWPYPGASRPIRVEHWVVAERHGEIAARNMLGERAPCRFAPFFWSQHYDVQISYVGHAEHGDETEVRGAIERRDGLVAFRRGGRIVAVATVGRDRASLRAELALERQDEWLAAPSW
jgi:NADPH-dependent 2,4-dienoyl-CoA reductase/sulfur reductase-like enzyme/nitrite reductase/ring-hydroxylating ferredoxin subunit